MPLSLVSILSSGMSTGNRWILKIIYFLFVCIIMNGNCFMSSMAKTTQMVGACVLAGSVLTVINSSVSLRFHYSFYLRGSRLGTSLREAVDAEIEVLSVGIPCRGLR